MLHVFSRNRVKLVARKPKATDIMGRREDYVGTTCRTAGACLALHPQDIFAHVCTMQAMTT
jgi:hypothetical protein